MTRIMTTTIPIPTDTTISKTITKLNPKQKIIKNYIKYIVYDDIKYINKIISLIDNDIINNHIQEGGNKNKDKNGNENGNGNEDKDDKSNYKKLNFVIKNIELIIKDIELFNKILNVIKNHDELMSKINFGYQKFNYDDNILNYLDKISKNEFIFV